MFHSHWWGTHIIDLYFIYKQNYFYMCYTALISLRHCSNDGNNKKFITIDICLNYVFLLILVRSSVTPTALRPS